MSPKKPQAPAAPRFPWDLVLLAPHEISHLKGISPQAFEVIEKICGIGRSPFTAGGEDGRRATDFACGQLWVANTLRQAREKKLAPNPRGAEPPMPAPPAPETS